MASTPRLSAAQKLVIQYYKAKLNLLHVVNARWAAASALDLFTRPYARRKKKDPEIWKTASEVTLRSGGLQLVGFTWKSRVPNGKQLLIIHGFAGNARSFSHFIKPALRLGYDVVTYDAPGHGRSEGKRLNVVSYKWMLLDVIKHHGLFDAYLAHSLGAMSVCLAIEELDPSSNTKMALVAPLTEATTAVNNFFDFLELPEPLKHRFELEIQQQSGFSLQWFSLPRILSQVQANVLWVHDREDDTTPFRDVGPFVPTAPSRVQFLITEGLGHSRIYRDNLVKKQVIDFLRDS